MKKTIWILIFAAAAASLQLGMARRGQYDEEAREQERIQKEQDKAQKPRTNAAKQFAEGLKQTTVDNAEDLVSSVRETSVDPETGETRLGSGKVLDNTVKGAAKVATLGFGHVDSYEVEEPAEDTDDVTKIKIPI